MNKNPLSTFAEQVLDLASHRTQQAEVYAVSSTETPVSFEANRLKQIRTTASHSLTLRVIADGHIGLASTTRLDAQDSLVDDALALAPFGSLAHFDLPSSSPQDDVPCYDPALAELTQERLIEIGKDVIDRVTAHNSNIVCAVDINKYDAEVAILNTHGCRASFRKTFLLLNLQASLIHGDDVVMVLDGDASSRQQLDFAGLVARVATQFELARRSVQVSSGEMPVIFTPKGFAHTLLPMLQDAFNGEKVLQGLSPLADRLGDRVADPRFSLYDNARAPYSPRAYPCDGEGVPTQVTSLIEKGVAKNFYYDLQTAALAGAQSTGSGWRLPGHKPSPTPAAAIIAAGDTRFEKMLTDIQNGILVDQTLGVEASDNDDGDFAAQVHLGYKIECGEIVGHIKNVVVSGNIFDALFNLAFVGDEAIWVAGSSQVPYLCFRALNITGAG
ncbi:PmbA protein [Anaerolineae bacterium]|nr:PmbA protein [Anaerolineae bacterium]